MAPSQPRDPPAVNTNSCFTKAEKKRIEKLLRQPLKSELIQQRPGHVGKKTYYLDGGTSYALANDIFGFDGWRSQIVSSKIEYAREKQKHSDRWLIGVSAIVRVELKNRSYHEDIGFGEAINMKGRGAALQKAKKEAITDVTKRALRYFGNGLGNCLKNEWYLKLIKNGDTFHDLQEETYHNVQLIDPSTATNAKKYNAVPEEKVPGAGALEKKRSKPYTIIEVKNKPNLSNTKHPSVPEKTGPPCFEKGVKRDVEQISPGKTGPPCFVKGVKRHVEKISPRSLRLKGGTNNVEAPPPASARFIAAGPSGGVVVLPSLRNPSQSPPPSFLDPVIPCNEPQVSLRFGKDDGIVRFSLKNEGTRRFGNNSKRIRDDQQLTEKPLKKIRFRKRSF